VLARSAASVVGIEPNPAAYEHARLRYPRVAFRRDIAETFSEPCDAVVFLQTIEHVADPGLVLDNIRAQLRPGGVAYVSTPNVLTLAPGAERSDNPWHVREYRPGEFAALCRAHFGSVAVLGVFHARLLRAHAVALRLGWDRVHRALGITAPFYDRFVPAISARDFAVRSGPLEGALDLLGVLR
jgi:SAM-dependent methyltransferase